jgi:DNA invertase Pin-like site-specific DNA recombinase
MLLVTSSCAINKILMALRRRREGPELEATAWGYVRYSTKRQGLLSVERQCEAIEWWAKRRGVTLLGISWDYERSRMLSHDDRHGLMWAIFEAMGPRRIGVLVAESVSRFAGDAVILAGIKDALPRWARLATSTETGNEDIDEELEDYGAINSKREIRQISQRIKGSLARLRARGAVSGNPPYGQRRKADGQHVLRDDGSRKCGPDCAGCRNLEPDPEEQRCLSRMRELDASGMTYERIGRRLTKEGFRNRLGHVWIKQRIQRLLAC